jgi:uncharacterized protein
MMRPQYGYALVTGASGGLGREFAKQLALSGWKLILVGRGADRLEETRRALAGPAAGEAIALRADLAEKGAAARLHDECCARGLEVELLVNNAGAGLFGKSVDLSSEKVESMLALNMLSLTSLCALFGADMAKKGSGRILNVGSLAGKYALPYFASYAASKSYVLSYSLALRAELKTSGVRVSCVLPGYIRTGFDESAGIGSPKYRAFSARMGKSPQAVARAGLAAASRNRPYAVAGGSNKIAAALSNLVPVSAMPALSKPFLDGMTGLR